MLRFTERQMQRLERERVCTRVLRFIATDCRRDDFRAWAQQRDRAEALWWPLWPGCRAHSEHDLALAMVVLAVAAHEGIALGDAVPVLQSVAVNEVRLKNMLAERGYFDFTAFDGDPAA